MLTSGTRLGPYEILAPIGAGGMGQVYRSKDTRLDRIVAIKILPPEFAARPDFRQRFEREAKAISSLNHPHICVLHDVGHQDGVDFLVMEYLQGETLAQRLNKGALPLDEALEYAIQIADALDKAHAGGVVHRDLKPGNIIITAAGAKILDFGLAKTREASPRPEEAVTSADALTQAGTIVGTVQYMSPEQLEGGEADARSDIFAFGAILYEMVSGRRPFQGKSQVSVMAAILEHDPAPLSSIQKLTPAALDYLVKVCLTKNPHKRWQTAGDLALQLKGITEHRDGEIGARPEPRKARVERIAWGMGIFAAFVLGIGIWSIRRGEPEKASLMRFEMETPYVAVGNNQIAISPDGRYFASRATRDGKGSLWLRKLDEMESHSIPGTEERQRSVLVSRQPVYRLFRRRQTPQGRCLRRTGTDHL